VKPPPFDYHLPRSVDEALALLAEHGDEAKVLAGGQSLIPLLSLRLARPALLIDINGLSELESVENGADLRLGALVRHREVERADTIRTACPLLARAASLIGHAAIRNRGTIGGTLAHADPSAEMPAVLVALGGEVEVRSANGSRSIGAEDMFEGFLTTVLDPAELVTAVRFPCLEPTAGWSFQEFSRRSGDFGLAAVAVVVRLDGDDRISEARIAFAGMAPTPVRARSAEAALAGQTPSADVLTAAAKEAIAGLEPPSDLHGSSAYRRHLASQLAERALHEAVERARGSQ
jgi:aerobic carbon-monoxide dehydrogenase medium subunit